MSRINMISNQGTDFRFLMIGWVILLTLLQSFKVDGASDVIVKIDKYAPCEGVETVMQFEDIIANEAPVNHVNVSFVLQILEQMPEPVLLDCTLGFKSKKTSPGPYINLVSVTNKDICPSLEKPDSTTKKILEVLGIGGEKCPIKEGTYDKKDKVLEIPENVRDVLANQEAWMTSILLKADKDADSKKYLCIDLLFNTKKVGAKKMLGRK